MNSDHPSLSSARKSGSPAAWLSSAFGLLLRGVLALSALVWLLLALVLGMVLALGLMLLAVLRGRRPELGRFRSAWRRTRRGPAPRPAEDLVIDVQVREVPAPENRSRPRT